MATKRKTTEQPRWLQVIEDRSHGYYTLQARVRVSKYDRAVSCQVPEGVDDEYGPGLLYTNLRLRAQGDERSRLDTERAEPVYGFAVTYEDVHRVDRFKARRMAKTLDTIAARLDKLQEQRGYPRSWGEHCGRLAEVLGCAGIVFERATRDWRFGGERWSWRTIGDGVDYANRLVRAWVDEGREAQKGYQQRQLPAAGETAGAAADVEGEVVS